MIGRTIRRVKSEEWRVRVDVTDGETLTIRPMFLGSPNIERVDSDPVARDP